MRTAEALPLVEPSALRMLPYESRRLLAVADRYLLRFARMFASALRENSSAVDVTALSYIITEGDRDAVETFLERSLSHAYDSLLTPTLRVQTTSRASLAFLDLMTKAAEAIRCKRNVCITGRFDATNPRAITWASKHSAELVVDITEETRRAIRRVIARGFNEGIPPRRLARILHDTVTLTEAQAEAVVNLHQKILTSPGKLLHVGKQPIRVPAAGMPDARIDLILRRYADKLTRQRALNIARTETISAANQGQKLLWKQAVDNGDLPKTAKRVWISAFSERTCPQCVGLDGMTVGLNETFGGIDTPPAHPRCRCSVGLV